MNLNSVPNLSHFEDPEIQDLINQVYHVDTIRGQGAFRKAWEIAMALRTSRIVPERKYRRAIGLGAGTEPTSFWLTNSFEEVHATDLYANAGAWSANAPVDFMINPEKYVPSGLEWNHQRLVVQHMDMKNLRYEDATFDFAYSSGSIEHVSDNPLDIIHVAKEVHRVLKRDGIWSLSTEYKLNSQSGTGWPGVMIFDTEMVQDLILTGGGFEMVDEFEGTVDDDTLATEAPLAEFVRMSLAGTPKFPDMVLSHAGYVYTSIHLALRKV